MDGNTFRITHFIKYSTTTPAARRKSCISKSVNIDRPCKCPFILILDVLPEMRYDMKYNKKKKSRRCVDGWTNYIPSFLDGPLP